MGRRSPTEKKTLKSWLICKKVRPNMRTEGSHFHRKTSREKNWPTHPRFRRKQPPEEGRRKSVQSTKRTSKRRSRFLSIIEGVAEANYFKTRWHLWTLSL